MNSTIYITNSF